MRKTLLSFIMILFPMLASADDSGSCGDGVTYYFDETKGMLTISKTGEGTGEMTDYNWALNFPWASFSNKILIVIIEEGVTSIGSRTFFQCSGIASVTIPNSVTSIGTSAFNGCNGLISITIPKGVTSIGGSAFLGCNNLTSITIPNYVTTIESFTFSGCSGLTSITIPDGVTSIGENAFSDCNGLTSITIPNTVTSFGYGAFTGCSCLTSINIPKDVTSIGGNAFWGCRNLTSITIPDGVTIIDEGTFSGCSKLTSIDLPINLRQIGQSGFSNCWSLETITIPATVELIYQQAFSDCSKLESITSLANNPPFCMETTFSNYDIPLYVPDESISLYQTTSPWSKFKEIKPLSGTELKQCAKPTITMRDGRLLFSSETEGATFVYHLNTPSAAEGEGLELTLPTNYTISVYAKKEGYKNSEPLSMTFDIRGKQGDVTGDGEVDATDITKLIDILLKKNTTTNTEQ